TGITAQPHIRSPVAGRQQQQQQTDGSRRHRILTTTPTDPPPADPPVLLRCRFSCYGCSLTTVEPPPPLNPAAPPLVQAIFNRNAEEVQLLLHKKEDVNALVRASVNAKDHVWLTPLHRAAASRNERAVGLLLRRGAEANARDKFWQTPLHVAAANRASRCAETLLSQLSNLNMADRTGRSALHHAAQSGFQEVRRGCKGWSRFPDPNPDPDPKRSESRHVEIVKLLVSRSADKGCKDKQGYTPLHAAAASGHLDIVKYLLRLGTEVSYMEEEEEEEEEGETNPWGATEAIDEPNSFGNTALHVACYTGQEAVATELVNHGANVNQPNRSGFTPLHLAAVSTNGALCLELLVNNGADVNQQSKEGKSPLHMAAIHGRFTRSQILIQNDVGSTECSLCTWLCSTGFQTVVASYSPQVGDEMIMSGQLYSIVSSMSKEHVLSAGFDINTPDNFGRTCLHAAASGGRTGATGRPCACSRRRRPTWTHRTPRRSVLYLAAQKGYVRCVEVLLAQGASCLLNDNRLMWTPIHVAAANGHTDCLLMMMENGEDGDLTNVTDTFGQSPLMLAVLGGHIECVRLLLERGALPDAKDKRGSTALHRGASALCRDVQGSTPLHYAASRGYTDILAGLAPAAVTSDPQDKLLDSKRYTPSHWAAMNGHCGAAERLLETAGVHMINTRDAKGRTPLHAAAFAEDVAGLQLVLRHGAQVNGVDESGRSALMVAADKGQSGTAHEMCALLILGEIHSPALINASNSSLQMPLHLAARNGLATVVQALLSRGATVLAVDEEGHTPALACAPNKDVADCLALILSTMKPFPPRDPSPCSCSPPAVSPAPGLNLLKHCGITAACAPRPSGGLLHNGYAKDRHGAAVGLDGCLME
ncbi:hypothetical protein CRUP_027672, partial [Coryphaenoides rupestris]